jgi:hypothetical protein
MMPMGPMKVMFNMRGLPNIDFPADRMPPVPPVAPRPPPAPHS